MAVDDDPQPASPDAATLTADNIADRLYGGPPEEFVTTRNALVKQLRSEGRRDLATEVAAWRRPTVAAAELNHVLRNDPAALESLLDAAGALAQGQRRQLAGESVDLRALVAAHRAAAGRLATSARRDADQVRATLERASLDEAAHPGLRSARYHDEPASAGGFDLLSGGLGPLHAARRAGPPPTDRAADTPTPETPTPDTPTPETPTPDTPTRGAPAGARHDPPAPAAAEASLTEDDDRARELAASRDHDRRVAAAREEAERAAVRGVTLAERRLTAAEASLIAAVQRVDDAEQRLETARHHLADTEERVAAAERALDAARRHAHDITGDDP